MKLPLLSSLSSAIATTIVMGLFVGNWNTSLAVNAQLFSVCLDFSRDGVTYDSCYWNTPSPVTFIVDDGSSIGFGTDSYVIASCISNTTRSIDTCSCNFIVNPSEPLEFSDFCNSCTVQIISDTEFLPSFDCSNRLVGDCVGFDLDGSCIDNNGGAGPAPVPAPAGTVVTPIAPSTPTTTNPAPRAPPTTPIPPTTTTTSAPRTPPTPFPISATTREPRPQPTPFPVETDPTLFYGCLAVEENGVPYDNCIYNTSSPVTYKLTDGSSRSFGTNSYITASCIANVTRSIDTCSCQMYVNPKDPPTSSDVCNSCTIQVMTGTVFFPYFDCSNRLIGECVGFDITGYCIESDDGDVPFPVPAPVPPRPTRAPTSAINQPASGGNIPPTRTAFAGTPPTRTFEGTDRKSTSSAMSVMYSTFGEMKMIVSSISIVALLF